MKMKKGKYANKRSHRGATSKTLALMLSLVLIVGCVAGGTLAWLTANTGEVENTFTESNIDVTLNETKPENKTAQMVPGWTIDKDPKATVTEGSEDCWLFVKITESANPDLDEYIAYAIAEGWEVKDKATPAEKDEIIIGRKVYKDDTNRTFSILGGGTVEHDGVTYSWAEDQVLTLPSVTKRMMDGIAEDSKPTLTFKAYAVQLFKTNSNGDKTNTGDEFTFVDAWEKANAMG